MMAHAIMSQPPRTRPTEPVSMKSRHPLEPFSETVMSHLLAARMQSNEQQVKEFVDEVSWLKFMASDRSDAMSAPLNKDLSFPLSSYFISSSHNTYLSGNQLYGEASGSAYTNVLVRGCRSLEIDVWDGDTDSSTSTSDTEAEKSDSKHSRWDRVKACATRMRSRSRSASHVSNVASEGQDPTSARLQPMAVPTSLETPLSTRQVESGSYGSSHLSPQPSPGLGPKAEPRVLHGHTLTQSVTFRTVCHAIRDSAFVSTDLPLIVSLEVHASLEQQEVMVEIMREVWSGYLVDLEQAEISSLPSPESLRCKILIKVKWTPNLETGESNDPLDHVSSSSTERPVEGTSTASEKRKKASKVLRKLSELGIYTRAYTFKDFSQPEAALPNHVFSLSERKIRDMQQNPIHGAALFAHNKNFLMRVFPKSTRINSSNVDPTFYWRTGAQMVALNWQKLDRAMMLNHGMFADTLGWVLKPQGYRCTVARDTDQNTIIRKRTLSLTIRLLAAQNLPVPADKNNSHASRMKPYIKAQLHIDSPTLPDHSLRADVARIDKDREAHDEEKDSSTHKRRSKTCRTDCPDFAGEVMCWPNMSDVMEELTFLRLKIMDDRSMGKDDVLAWACIRLDRLQLGYRFVHILTPSGVPCPGALLVHVSKGTT